jgi:hypothetical protein
MRGRGLVEELVCAREQLGKGYLQRRQGTKQSVQLRLKKGCRESFARDVAEQEMHRCGRRGRAQEVHVITGEHSKRFPEVFHLPTVVVDAHWREKCALYSSRGFEITFESRSLLVRHALQADRIERVLVFHAGGGDRFVADAADSPALATEFVECELESPQQIGKPQIRPGPDELAELGTAGHQSIAQTLSDVGIALRLRWDGHI